MNEAASDQKGLPPSRVRYQVLSVVCVLAVVTYLQRLGFSSASPEIMRSLHLDSRHIGDLAAAFLIAYGIFQVPGGLLGDRLGGRTVLTLLVLGWSLLTAVVAVTIFLPASMDLRLFDRDWILPVQFGFLLVMRFLFGAFQAGGFPVLGRIMADWMRLDERGFAQGTIWMISRFGGFLVPFVFAGLFWFFDDWPMPFVILGGLGLVWCGFFWRWFRNHPSEMESVNAAERALIAAGRGEPLKNRPRTPWRRMTTSLSVWSLCLMYGFVGFPGNFFTNMVPTYLSEERSTLSPHVRAWLAALPLGFGAVACILGGVLSDWLIRRTGSRRWGRRAVGMMGPVVAALAFFSVHQAQETWLLGLLLTVTFFGNDLIMGSAWASCADVGERFAGTLSGAMNMTGAFAGAGAMALAGRLLNKSSDWYNPSLMFGIFASSYAVAAVCWLGIDATKRISQSDS
jgi:MFS transporter, ACS family, glucarate transporter